MEWRQNLEWGPEFVYAILGAVVTGVGAWLARGFMVKRQIRALEAKLDRERIEARKEVVALREQIATTSKADAVLKAALASKAREESLELRRKRLLKQERKAGADLMGLPYRDDE